MLAVFESGGKQYLAEQGKILKLERVDAAVGNVITADNVLMVSCNGSIQFNPASSLIKMYVLEQKRDKKVIVFKKKRRKNYRRKQGHRQNITIVQVQEIALN